MSDAVDKMFVFSGVLVITTTVMRNVWGPESVERWGLVVLYVVAFAWLAWIRRGRAKNGSGD